MRIRDFENREDITTHASQRMSERAISNWQIDQVLQYGRKLFNRHAIIYAVGRKEVQVYGRFLEPCEGIHVICSSVDDAIITTYRNHSLKNLRHCDARPNRRWN